MSFLTVCVIATNPHINYVKVNTDASTVKWKGSKITESHEGTIRLRSGVLAFDHGKFVGGEFVINMATIKRYYFFYAYKILEKKQRYQRY